MLQRARRERRSLLPKGHPFIYFHVVLQLEVLLFWCFSGLGVCERFKFSPES
jgi:hypothetical protein